MGRCTTCRTYVHISSPAWDLLKSKGRWNISICQERHTKTRSCSLRVEAHLRPPPFCHDSENLTQIASNCSAANHLYMQLDTVVPWMLLQVSDSPFVDLFVPHFFFLAICTHAKGFCVSNITFQTFRSDMKV